MQESHENKMKVCVIDETGTRQCLDIGSPSLVGKSPLGRLIFGLMILFLVTFIAVSIVSFYAGTAGFNPAAALILTGLILLYPATLLVFASLAYFVYKSLNFDSAVNILILIAVILALGFATYFIYIWATPLVIDAWEITTDSWK